MSAGLAREYRLVHLGSVEYGRAWRWQQDLVRARQADHVPDTLLLLEHPHVYTLGRAAHAEHVLLPREELARRGIAVFEVDRGGDVTYHGPGQLVGYPIVSLAPWGNDVRRYITMLEAALVQTLAEFGIAAAGLLGDYTGVWVGDDKIAAIGVRTHSDPEKRVTSHGFALNVNTDLSYFGYIVPCGLRDKGVTSMERLLGRPIPMAEVRAAFVQAFAATFGYASAGGHPLAGEDLMWLETDDTERGGEEGPAV